MNKLIIWIEEMLRILISCVIAVLEVLLCSWDVLNNFHVKRKQTRQNYCRIWRCRFGWKKSALCLE